MYFIAIEPIPLDKNGEIAKTFDYAVYSNSDGFDYPAILAVPVTNFLETLVSLLMSTPNMPMVLNLYKADEYVKITKRSAYENLNKENKKYELTNSSDKRLVDYVLNRNNIGYPLYSSSILNIYNIMEGGIDVGALFGLEPGKMLSKEHAKKIGMYMYETMVKVTGDIEDTEKLFQELFHIYQYTALPVVVDLLVRSFGEGSKCEFDNELKFNLEYIQSVHKNRQSIINYQNKIAEWIKGDMPNEEIVEIYENIQDEIIENRDVLEQLYFNRKIGRNDPCPCGSGKKYKKCHGK